MSISRTNIRQEITKPNIKKKKKKNKRTRWEDEIKIGDRYGIEEREGVVDFYSEVIWGFLFFLFGGV